jgi:hypothetical protein
MVLTREEKECLVIDLYNRRTPIREIAREARMSFRDIGRIIDKKEKEKEALQGQVRQITQSTQAYKLFSEGKSPVQVAIELNIRASEAIIFQREYWELEGLHNLNQIYEETKVDTWHFVNLCKSVKSAGMGVQHVVKLLEIANNDLPAVEYRHERLKREVDSLESWKLNSNRVLENVTKNIEHYSLCCQRELAQMDQLYQKRMKLKGLVRHFQNNNEEYIKIKKTVEEKVHSVLSDRKMVLKLALLSLTESMRKDPDKYSHLIHNNTSSSSKTPSTKYSSQYYATSNTYGQQQQYPSQAYTDMLLEEAEKLYNKLTEELGDEITSDYASSTSSSLLPVLPSTEEQQSHPAATTTANQTHMHTEEHGFSQSETDDN